MRSTLPCYRYDKLMGLDWKNYLLISLTYLMLYFGMSLLSLFFIL